MRTVITCFSSEQIAIKEINILTLLKKCYIIVRMGRGFFQTTKGLDFNTLKLKSKGDYEMGKCSLRRYSMITVLATVFASSATFADENLTPEQLILLMRTSSERYVSFDAKIKSMVYEATGKDSDPKLKLESEITSRWLRNKSYSKTVQTEYFDTTSEGRVLTRTDTYAITPTMTKQLVEMSDSSTPKGYIKSGKGLDPFYPLYDAMWDIWGPWEEINLEQTTLTRDAENNCYVMKIKMGDSIKGPFIKMYIDPSKGFIPFKKEIMKYDGTLITTHECSDFRQVKKDLWIPYQYFYNDPRTAFSYFYNVEEVTVNDPINEDMLDFAFPEGTIVHDQINNMEYKVGLGNIVTTEDINQLNPEILTAQKEKNVLKPEGIVMKLPPKDSEFLASVEKTKELLYTAHSHEKHHYNIYLAVIIISAGIVGLVSVFRAMFNSRDKT